MNEKERKPKSKQADSIGDEKPRPTRARSSRKTGEQENSGVDALSTSSFPKGTDEHSRPDETNGRDERVDELDKSISAHRNDDFGEVH